MSRIQVNQLKAHFDKLFADKIDISDDVYNDGHLFYTRALAAFTIMALSGTTVEDACSAITDGFGDNGIDAIYYNASFKELLLIQSKWIQSGTGEPQTSDVNTFIIGVRDLLELRFDRFNSKVNDIVNSLGLVDVLNDVGIKIRVVLSYTGSDCFSDNSQRAVSLFLDEVNEASDLMTFERFPLKKGIQSLINQFQGKPVNTQIIINNWFKVDNPYFAIFGLVDGKTLSDLWLSNRLQLLSENIREFIGFSNVNSELKATAVSAPEKFLYFNNGITALCDSIKKTAVYGADHSVGSFKVENLKIVNGAQTVGSIAEAYLTNQESVERVLVLIKIVSLENCPDGFGDDVTQKTNTQNRVERRDFLSMDTNQKRLQEELSLEGIRYQIKRTSEQYNQNNSCNSEEVIISVGCSLSDVSVSTLAKREVGKLWESISSTPYTSIIDSHLHATKAWRCVRILRRVSEIVSEKTKEKNGGRINGCYIHSNRLVLHIVFNKISQRALNDSSFDFDSFYHSSLDNLILSVEAAIYSVVEQYYSSSMLPQLFKNYSKTKDVKEKCLQLLDSQGLAIE
ncbi:MAG: AIPR family protein [Bacteroidales bacterium]|nr:AIPR family protein [Bacteroidales bacterium]